jgi:hypothetical protein
MEKTSKVLAPGPYSYLTKLVLAKDTPLKRGVKVVLSDYFKMVGESMIEQWKCP